MQEAKSAVTMADGIGTDLRPAVFGWRDDRCIGYAQLKNVEKDDLLQLAKISEAAGLMRSGWGIEAAVLGSENFVATGADHNDDSLAKRFAEGDTNVVETITVLAVHLDEALVLSMPYRYEIGRTVAWDTPLLLEGVPMAAEYPSSLARALTAEPEPDTETVRVATAHTLSELGFAVRTYEGFLPES